MSKDIDSRKNIAEENRAPLLSIVSPVYKADTIVDELVLRIKETLHDITDNFEIILVEDGSPDRSWEKIEDNCGADVRIKGIRLSRNFGQHYAITAGLAESRGDYVVVLDCDLQDNPKYIQELLNKSKEGFDIVFTIKQIREHNKLKNLSATCFDKVFNWLIGDPNLHYNSRVGSYSLVTRKVVEAFCSINDYYRPYLVVLQWLGFASAYVSIEHDKRFEGRSSYTFSKLLSHAFNGIVSQTEKLLKLSIYTGFLFFLISIISIIYIVLRSVKSGFQPGWASTTVLIILSTGLILMSLGIVGVYIGKIFEQMKKRPLYIISKKLNTEQ
ncbi:MAG: glycosyltransferase family 2 protein [Thermodesulfobacteriota bacterium]